MGSGRQHMYIAGSLLKMNLSAVESMTRAVWEPLLGLITFESEPPAPGEELHVPANVLSLS